MTSWGGMFRVIVRRSTLTIRSTTGIRRKRPGPFGCGSRRPRRKTIPRSYSRATLIAEMRKSRTRKRRTTTMTIAAVTERSYPQESVGDLLDLEDEPRVDACDPDALAGPQWLAVRGPRTPELAVDEDQVVAARLAHLADDRLRPDGDGSAPDLHRLRQSNGPDRPEADREPDQQRQVDVVVRSRRVVEEHQRAHDDADEPGDGERSVTRHVRVDDQQRGSED